jgi:hypothetical protein
MASNKPAGDGLRVGAVKVMNFSDVHLICELARFPKSFWLD